MGSANVWDKIKRKKTDKRREAADKYQGKEQSKGFSGGKKQNSMPMIKAPEWHAYENRNITFYF